MLEDTLSERSVRQREWLPGRGEIRESVGRGEFIQVKQAFSLVTLELWWCRIFVGWGGHL